MDTRKTFLKTSGTILQASVELSMFRIVGNTTAIALYSVNATDRDLYKDTNLPAIEELKKVGFDEFISFNTIFDESSAIIAYSWLDTFISELEEVLFLHDPSSLGESVQVKFGKILSSDSIDDLIHDLAKKKTREKGQWSLKNRILELKEKYGLSLSLPESELEWITDLRNNLIHNRRIGEFRSNRGKVKYETIKRRQIEHKDIVRKFLHVIFSLLCELYKEGAKVMSITCRFPEHRKNLELLASFERSWRL